MSVIGQVGSLWRYPVKGMRGEELDELFVSYGGVYGDRLFAFASSAKSKGFPFFTGRDQAQMILHRARFRYPEKAARPINFYEAQKHSPNINPISASAAELMIDVETPDGKTFAIDDPKLIEHLRASCDNAHEITLLRSDKPLTDCRPLSLISNQTIERLSDETGMTLDRRRFRANVYVDLATSFDAFAEDAFVGKSWRIGSRAVVRLLQRDTRCAIITLDPDTAEKSPQILKSVAQEHEGKAGVYSAVLVEGLIRRGDAIELVND